MRSRGRREERKKNRTKVSCYEQQNYKTSYLGSSIVCTIIHNYFVNFSKFAKVLWSLQKLQTEILKQQT